tara:strand:- start:174 stop:599 length:426 start_codon:yes stop_codon:yes gene_type:complete
MNLAKQINKKLDEILSLKEELELMEAEVPKGSIVTNKETGDKMTVEDAVEIAYGVIRKVKDDLNTITNDGRNVKDIFTNIYYVNDVIQDKQLRDEQIAKENKLNKVDKVSGAYPNEVKELYNKLNGIKKMPNIEDDDFQCF